MEKLSSFDFKILDLVNQKKEVHINEIVQITSEQKEIIQESLDILEKYDYVIADLELKHDKYVSAFVQTGHFQISPSGMKALKDHNDTKKEEEIKFFLKITALIISFISLCIAIVELFR